VESGPFVECGGAPNELIAWAPGDGSFAPWLLAVRFGCFMVCDGGTGSRFVVMVCGLGCGAARATAGDGSAGAGTGCGGAGLWPE
jgi:hypothetical protein